MDIRGYVEINYRVNKNKILKTCSIFKFIPIFVPWIASLVFLMQVITLPI